MQIRYKGCHSNQLSLLPNPPRALPPDHGRGIHGRPSRQVPPAPSPMAIAPIACASPPFEVTPASHTLHALPYCVTRWLPLRSRASPHLDKAQPDKPIPTGAVSNPAPPCLTTPVHLCVSVGCHRAPRVMGHCSEDLIVEQSSVAHHWLSCLWAA
jgi:hypothetical protein